MKVVLVVVMVVMVMIKTMNRVIVRLQWMHRQPTDRCITTPFSHG
jgi:hypothetical protein